MPTFIAPSFAPNAAGASASSTASGPRGRNAEEADGRSFNAVLTRSRGAGQSQQAKEDSASPALEGKARQKPSRAGDRKDDLTIELPLAFFAPTMTPLASSPAAASALPGGATVAATLPEGAQSLSTAEAAVAALPADAPAAALPGDATDAEGVEGETPATAALPRDAQALASEIAQPKNKDHPEAVTVPPVAQLPTSPALPAADAPAAAGAVPVAATAPSGDAIAATVTAIASEAAKAAAASPAADEALSAPTAAMLAADKPDLGAAASNAADPFTPPQAMTFATAAADRANLPAGTSQVPVMHVAPPVGSDEWGPALGHQMLRMNAAGAQVAELNLNPAGLGPLKVTLSMGDNQAQAMFVSAHESVRKAVEAALPQLRASLAEQGISLGQASVGAEAHRFAGQGGAFDQQARQQQGSGRQPQYPAPGRAEAAALAEPLHGSLPPAASRTSSAGVDTFA
ncbi:flagellar hook-length control protein FliK [Variovorax sp. DXTD-1]|uniref:flagellar hook-length control protein FliK n=1 Tax=Variovorax sp. DXTD-1 TaxID=2495592 RepID=UPI000F89574C|nr:flagellar hook-length control protein FliK [Variovorax sp. DXTD-1]RST49014.1 flagellar hook-length control protein FliK [Variovorax sp. DXTD-1]